MRQIVLKQQTAIGPLEGRLYPALMRALSARDWSPTLWSTAQDPRIAPWCRPSSWALGRWPSLWPELSLGEATLRGVETEMHRMIDVDRWWPRIQRLAKQGIPPGPTAERRALLRIAFAVSRHVVANPELRRFVAWNPHCPHSGIAAELARGAGLEVTTLERGFLPDTWMVDAGGLMGDSRLAWSPLEELMGDTGDDPGELRRAGARWLSRAGWGSFERYAQRTDGAPPDHDGPRIVVLGSDDVTTGFCPPSHDDRRRTRPGFRSSLAVAAAVARVRPDALVAFKPHPSMVEASTDREEFEIEGVDAPDNLIVVDHDFRGLIRWSHACVTAGSTSGFVALAMDRPLVVTAREALSGKGIAHEAFDEDQLSEGLEAALSRRGFARRRSRFAAFVGWLRRHYLYDLERVEGLADAVLAPLAASPARRTA